MELILIIPGAMILGGILTLSLRWLMDLAS